MSCKVQCMQVLSSVVPRLHPQGEERVGPGDKASSRPSLLPEAVDCNKHYTLCSTAHRHTTFCAMYV